MNHRGIERVDAAERPRFRQDKHHCTEHHRNGDLQYSLDRERRHQRLNTVMVPVVERARVFDRVGDQMAMDEGFPRDQFVSVGSRKPAESQHGTHRDNRDAES